MNGKHYAKTLDAWLAILDSKREEVMPILEECYGKDKALRWFINWRMFYLVCSETFGFDGGDEWFVGLYLFTKD